MRRLARCGSAPRPRTFRPARVAAWIGNGSHRARVAGGHRGAEMTESANKRRVTAQRNDRKAAKRERRQQRRHEDRTEPVDPAEIMSRFHRLNELRLTRAIT